MPSKYVDLTIPTYEPGSAEPYPKFFENRPYQGASGKIYPLPYTTAIADTCVQKTYRAVVLENQWIHAEVLPQIGGKVFRALDRTTDYDFVYYNRVIKPAMIGLAGPWVSGGIEFNWPQHHRPTTFSPVDHRLVPNGVELTETDPLEHLQSSLTITVPEDRAYIEAHVRVFNPTDKPRPFMWWSNLAVEVNSNYKVVFPPDVEYVNDHDRRAAISWPIARGIYKTARPYDYGQGEDLHHLANVKVQSSFMVSKGESAYDFVSGWDAGVQCGTVSVSDRAVGTGKKLFTWGQHPFGKNWCSNLTDNGSIYAELMTGAFTDNQPDFTWILPQEEKSFTQYWYPIHAIGEVKNATVDAACSLHTVEDGLFAGICVTGRFPGSVLEVRYGQNLILQQTLDLDPDHPVTQTIPVQGIDLQQVTLQLADSSGRILVSYIPPVRGKKHPQKMRLPAPLPETLDTVEELYLNGRHLEQYKHFNRQPELYYQEALRRDPGDSRSNTAMGNILLEQGRLEEAVAYFDKAIDRLTLRNANPEYLEPFYRKGVALELMGKGEEARVCFEQSVWGSDYRNAGYYALAKNRLRVGDTERGRYYLTQCNSRSAQALAAALDGRTTAENWWTPYACQNVITRLDTARQVIAAGLQEQAVEVLLENKEDSLSHYYLYFLTGEEKHLRLADAGRCWPSCLEDIAVLRRAGTPHASYALGCLYYDRKNHQAARTCWLDTLKQVPNHTSALYCMALYENQHNSDPFAAQQYLQKVFALAPDAAVFSDLCVLHKSMGMNLSERLQWHEAHLSLSASRDDCVLDHAQILHNLGLDAQALELLAGHAFHTYEGGEGLLTRLHMEICSQLGQQLLTEGKTEDALDLLEHGTEMPENYGEVNSYFAQTEAVYYTLGCAYAQAGNTKAAEAAFVQACFDPCAPTDVNQYQALALARLGKVEEARAVVESMRAMAQSMQEDDQLAYFGVGAPQQQPFGKPVLAERKEKAAAIAKAAAEASTIIGT